MSCGCRCGSDPELLWLWHRRVAVAPVRPLIWEPPYAMGAGLKRQKKIIIVSLSVTLSIYIYIYIYIYENIYVLTMKEYRGLIQREYKSRKKAIGVPTMVQLVKDPGLSPWHCWFDPWPCTVG